MPERELRQRIRAALKRSYPGALVLQWPSNMWTGPGWPDLLFSEWPLLVGFEIKYGRKSKPTPIQRSRHVELRNHHVPVYVVYGPDDAVSTITTLKEKLPMAFDPALLAELDAALNASPEPEAAPEPEAPATNGTALEDLPTFDDVVIEGEDSVPGIEDLTAAVAANVEIAAAETDALEESVVQVEGFLSSLKASIDALTEAVIGLRADLNADIETSDSVPQTAEAPAPRRRTRRS